MSAYEVLVTGHVREPPVGRGGMRGRGLKGRGEREERREERGERREERGERREKRGERREERGERRENFHGSPLSLASYAS
ncbi:hypothetical protein [Planktothricoides raciborskii]|uniref:Uncharacterized protein n=2 Tax=Planktothricoides TaxID=132607 RepID=A0ABR8ELV5_9CYAN|nr:hypothetical protein [Planktothricoides raciborskii]MBD2547656.1 hypothetical protein [Planktothricoides raciborskii FACHB-1370]MBD2585179.1 hypothetical protein [Planktothricoides raciborskii FACHB-1261]